MSCAWKHRDSDLVSWKNTPVGKHRVVKAMSSNRGLAVLSQLLNLSFRRALRYTAGSLIFDKQCYIYSVRSEGGQDRGRVLINDEMSLLPSIPELHFPPLTSVHTCKTVTLHQTRINLTVIIFERANQIKKDLLLYLNQGRQTEAAKKMFHSINGDLFQSGGGGNWENWEESEVRGSWKPKSLYPQDVTVWKQP